MEYQKVKELLISIASGNQNAFRSIFLHYFPKVKQFIAHLLKDEMLAEDLSQDIFAKLWINREKLLTLTSFDAYIYQMAKNAVLNEIKKIGVVNKYNSYEYSRNNQSISSIEEEYLAKEIELLVELTIEKMPEQRKKIYQMSRHQGLTNEEISQTLHITKKTVENHLNLALKEIRKTISLAIVFFI